MSKNKENALFEGKTTQAFDKFAGYYSHHWQGDIFRHLLHSIMYLAAQGNAFQKQYEEAIAIFDKDKLQEMISRIVQDSEGFNDVLGDIYMNIASSSHASAMGQFFTPQCVINVMCQITDIKGVSESSDKPLRIGDLGGCGSGRTIISAAKCCGEKRYKYYFEGIDLDGTCAIMAVLNCYFNAIPARIVHGDALELTTYNVYECCLNYIELGDGREGFVPFIMQFSDEECKAYEEITRGSHQKVILDKVNEQRVINLEAKKEKIQADKVDKLKKVFEKIQGLDEPQSFEQPKTQKAAKKGENDAQNTLF